MTPPARAVPALDLRSIEAATRPAVEARARDLAAHPTRCGCTRCKGARRRRVPAAAARTVVRCPWCAGRYEDAAHAAERRGVCPHCGTSAPTQL